MNQGIDFTQPGGLWAYQNTFDFLQGSYSAAIDAIATLFGDKVIVQGLVITGGNISDGWVAYNGELIPVTGGTLLNYLHLNTVTTNEQYEDGSSKPIYTTKNFQFTATSGGNVAFSLFKRLPYNSSTLYDALNNVKSLLTKIINVESAVILSGCAISSVSGTSSGTCNISAGVVLMDGEIVNAPAQNAQTFPFWLKPDGTYVTSDPGGTNVLFNYETSQRYAHVLKRLQHGSGEIVMTKSSSDLALFDASSGLGKWKWLGWKICADMQSRSPVGYDKRTSPPGGDDAGAWAASNNTIDNFYGGRNKTIDPGHLPNIRLKILQGDGTTPFVIDTAGGGSLVSLKGDNDNSLGNGYLETEPLGNADDFDVMNPSRVILFIERI